MKMNMNANIYAIKHHNGVIEDILVAANKNDTDGDYNYFTDDGIEEQYAEHCNEMLDKELLAKWEAEHTPTSTVTFGYGLAGWTLTLGDADLLAAIAKAVEEAESDVEVKYLESIKAVESTWVEPKSIYLDGEADVVMTCRVYLPVEPGAGFETHTWWTNEYGMAVEC